MTISRWVTVLIAGSLAVAVGCESKSKSPATSPGADTPPPARGAEAPAVLQTAQDRQDYAIGVEVARNFKRQGMEVDAMPELAVHQRDERAL